MKHIVYALVILLVISLVACKKDNEPQPILSEDSTIVAYLDSLSINYQVDDDGIYLFPIVSNPSGKRQDQGKILSIYYKLSTLNGTVLEDYDSLDGPPVRLKQGVNAVYPVGIDRALNYLGEGEEWGFVIPSALAYVDYSSSLIPEKAILYLEVTLKKIQNEDDVLTEDIDKIITYADSVKLVDTVAYPLNQPKYWANGMVYKRIAAGTGGTYPSVGTEVAITYSGYLPYLQDSPFDVTYASNANPFVYNFNQNVVISGLDAGIGGMERGERALFIIPSYLGYRESVRIFPNYSVLISDLIRKQVIPAYSAKVGPYEVLIFDVRLLDIR